MKRETFFKDVEETDTHYLVPRVKYNATINLLLMTNRQVEIGNSAYNDLLKKHYGQSKEMLESERKANEILTNELEVVNNKLAEAMELLSDCKKLELSELHERLTYIFRVEQFLERNK